MKQKFIFIFFMLLSIGARAQESTGRAAVYNTALSNEYNGRIKEALSSYQQLLKIDSNNIDYLTRTSILLSKTGHYQSDEKVKLNYGQTAEYLARKAIKVQPTSGEAHYALALAIGVVNENAGNRTKIDNAKIIRSEAETALKYNPRIGGAWHILGKWNQVVAGFNFIEKAMIDAIFGNMGEGTYEAALNAFSKASNLEPTNAIHYFELANTYYERGKTGDKARALDFVNKALQIKPRNEDEQLTVVKAKELLQKLR